MPISEKSRPFPNNQIDTSIPTDLPPSYENTIIPGSNPWTDTPSTTQPTQPQRQPQTQTLQPPISVPSQNPLSSLPRLSTIPFSKYRVRESQLSDDQTTITTTSPDLTSTGSNTATNVQTRRNIAKFINEQACLPPKPIMIIKGTHQSSGTLQPAVDFELKFNLTSLLDIVGNDNENGDRSQNAGPALGTGVSRSAGTVKVTQYQHGSSNGSPKQLSKEERNLSPVELWVKKFCDDKAENRSFTLSRTTSTLPTSLLEGYIRNLLASTRYRGKLTVSFPVQNASVTILRKSSNWFTNMLRLYPTKKYEVVNVDWAVVGTRENNLNHDSSDDGATVESSSGRPTLQRSNTSHSATSDAGADSGASTSSQHVDSPHGLPALVAQAWWREWHFAIWNAVLSGKKGWVTVEDWIEAKMGVREKEREKEWGGDYE